MSFYFMNFDVVPPNPSSVAFFDSIQTITPLPVDTFGSDPNSHWPLSGSPKYSIQMKPLANRKYKNFAWNSINAPWYQKYNLLFLIGSDLLFPVPYGNIPWPTNNNYIQEQVTQVIQRWRPNVSLFNTFGLSPKVKPQTSTSNNTEEYQVSHHELGLSKRKLAVVPGDTGDQYEFDVFHGSEIVTMGEPQVLAVWRHNLGDYVRPHHYFNSDGTPWNPMTSPDRDRIFMYNGNYAYGNQDFANSPAYFFDKTEKNGRPFNLGENYVGSIVGTSTFRSLRSATKFFPNTVNISNTIVQSSSLLLETPYPGSTNQNFNEYFDRELWYNNHNEQHTGLNLICSYIALTGDYMAEDELDFIAIPELLMYRPWLDPNLTGSVSRTRPRFPGGGDREMGRKLIAYTNAMRVSKGETFTKYHALSKQLCDMVESVFRNRSNNYANESIFGAILYTNVAAGIGEASPSDKNRVYIKGASSLDNFVLGQTSIIGPWQLTYNVRGIYQYLKYNDDPKYRDLLLRFLRSLLLFGIYKERPTLPAGRRGSFNNYEASAPSLYPGMYKAINYLRCLDPARDSESNGAYYKPIDASSFYECDVVAYRDTNGVVRTASWRPFKSGPGGIPLPNFSPGGFNLNEASYYRSSEYRFTVSAGVSAGPDGYGYFVSGVCPLGTPSGAFLSEFNREIELATSVSYIDTWITPSLQIAISFIKDSDESRISRIIEAREIARECFNQIYLHPTGDFPSVYKTMIGHSGDYTTAPVVPGRSSKGSPSNMLRYAAYGPIP